MLEKESLKTFLNERLDGWYIQEIEKRYNLKDNTDYLSGLVVRDGTTAIAFAVKEDNEQEGVLQMILKFIEENYHG